MFIALLECFIFVCMTHNKQYDTMHLFTVHHISMKDYIHNERLYVKQKAKCFEHVI